LATFHKRLTKLGKPPLLLSFFVAIREYRYAYDDGVLSVIAHGSKRVYKAADRQQFRNYLAGKYHLTDLEETFNMLGKKENDRAKQVRLTGDSKFVHRRVMKGFLINSYVRIKALLNSKPFIILPPDGSYLFIYDYEQFSIPEDTLVIGIENSENFRKIRQQKWLFDEMFPNRIVLFVSRYPQNESHDLVKWLGGIPNEYVHFGDLDLAGIRIFLTEFHRYLGDRASFLIPTDYEDRIRQGSSDRYNAQLQSTKNMVIDDPRLLALVDCINKCHRGYDQEGFCKA
jgi:hypothetical protein